MIKYFKSNKETLESRIDELERRIQELEHPQKFNVGDKVQFIKNGVLKTVTITFIGDYHKSDGRLYYYSAFFNSDSKIVLESVFERDLILVSPT